MQVLHLLLHHDLESDDVVFRGVAGIATSDGPKWTARSDEMWKVV